MTRKLYLFTLVGLVAWSLPALAQPLPRADEPAAVGPSPAITNAAAKPQSAPETAPVATNAPAAEATDQPAANAAPTQAVNDPASGALQPGVVIPLIVMDDVPLTDAIKNLARQAGLNYLID